MKIKRITKNQLVDYLIIIAIFLSMGAMIFGFAKTEYSYKMYENDTSHYVRGTVTEVIDQKLVVSGTDKFCTGVQKIKVKLKQGEFKGETVEITNSVTARQNVVVSEGKKVIVCVDAPENVEPYFTLYNYDRSSTIWVLAVVFVLLVVLVGE